MARPVYFVDSPGATSFHYFLDCQALKRARHQIVEDSVAAWHRTIASGRFGLLGVCPWCEARIDREAGAQAWAAGPGAVESEAAAAPAAEPIRVFEQDRSTLLVYADRAEIVIDRFFAEDLVEVVPYQALRRVEAIDWVPLVRNPRVELEYEADGEVVETWFVPDVRDTYEAAGLIARLWRGEAPAAETATVRAASVAAAGDDVPQPQPAPAPDPEPPPGPGIPPPTGDKPKPKGSLAGLWRTEDGDRVRIDETGGEVRARFVRGGECRYGGKRDLLFLATRTGNRLQGTIAWCRHDEQIVTQCGQPDAYQTTFKASVTAEGDIDGTVRTQWWTIHDEGGCSRSPSEDDEDPLLLTRSRVDVARFELLQSERERRDAPAVSRPLEYVSTRSANAESEQYTFLGRVELRGGEGERVDGAVLEVVRDGEVLLQVDPTPEARDRLLREFPASGRIAFDASELASGGLFRASLDELSEVCRRTFRAGSAPPGDTRSTVTLRLRVTVESGQDDEAEVGPVRVLVCFERLVKTMEEQLLNASRLGISDRPVRAAYDRDVRRLSALMWRDVVAGTVPADVGAWAAWSLRREMKEAMRRRSTAVGAALARAADRKEPLAKLLERRIARRFGESVAWENLRPEARLQVFGDVVAGSGQSRATITRHLVPAWGVLSIALFVAMGAFIAWDVWTAENPVTEGLREVIHLGGAAAGSALLAAAATGLVGGPPGAIVTIGLFVVGGFMGALLADYAADRLEVEKRLEEYLAR